MRFQAGVGGFAGFSMTIRFAACKTALLTSPRVIRYVSNIESEFTARLSIVALMNLNVSEGNELHE